LVTAFGYKSDVASSNLAGMVSCNKHGSLTAILTVIKLCIVPITWASVYVRRTATKILNLRHLKTKSYEQQQIRV
jgi:hypothetical protein